MSTIILSCSILLQFTAAALAFRQIRSTGYKIAWGCITVALALMGLRRAITWFRVVTGDQMLPPDPTAELVALLISLLMFVGVLLIGRLFHEIQENKDKAERASQAKSDFLAAMSHDLRTPLNAIMGFSDMMRTKTFGPLGNPHYETYADDIYESGTLLVGLINDVLDLSKIEAGKYDLAEETLDVSDLIETSIRQVTKVAETTHKTLSVDVAVNFPSLRGEKRALIQVINNLLSNAIKFTPDGGAIKVVAQTDTIDQITIQVIDNGIGMSPNDIAKALQPFEQADGMRSRKHEGTGLGLYLCVNFMELFGGTLDVESSVGHGTTVSLRFPKERTVFPS